MAAVSVIVPTHNRAGVLRDALESIVRQSFEDFEVVVVDDHSDDAEAARRVVDSLSDPRFRCIYLDRNRGPAGARNEAAGYCTGEYLSFLDDDDLLLPDKLKVHVGLLQSHPDVAMVYSDEYILQRNGVVSDVTWRAGRTLPSGDIARDFFMESFIGTMTVTLRRSAFDEANGFDESLIWNEDDDLWFRVMMRHPVQCSEYAAGIRRVHRSNMSRDRKEMVLSQFRCIEKYIALYPEFIEANDQDVRLRAREIWRGYLAGRIRKLRAPSLEVRAAYLELLRRLSQPVD